MSQPMTDPSAPYRKLLELYLVGEFSTEEFCRRYDEAFLADSTIFEPELYEILNELFIDTEALTSNPVLIAERPSFHLNDAQFHQKAKLAAARLGGWLDGGAAPA
jgi:hypothetical protein